MKHATIASVLLLVFVACEQQPPSPFQNLNADYVGIDACAACHPDKAATFTQSQMGRSWELARPVNSKADFDNPTPVYDDFNDLYYEALRKGEELYVVEYRLSGQDTVHKRVEQIDYIVGSGHHTNSHIMDVNGYLYQMPLTWYVQEGKWDLPPGFIGPNNNRFDRPIPLKCMSCHNAMPAYVEGSENRYVSVPHGIDCERCHGPGSLHIESVSGGNAVNTRLEADYTIVNPARLSVEQQFDICQGCHLQGASVNKPGHTFADFRPGMPLSDIENVFWPRYADSLRQFVMASHPDRLSQSACFQASEAMTCSTCHDPHVPIEAMAEDHYRDVCQSCHTGSESSLVCPTPEAAAGADCTSCHMPVSGSQDIPHITITDHFIRSPGSDVSEVVSSEAQADFVRMASLIDESPSDAEIAAGFLTYYETITNAPGFLDSAAVYLRRADRAGENVDVQLIRMHFLKGEATSVLRIARNLEESISDAWTAYRIGEAYLTQEMPESAITYLEQAMQLAPEHLRFMVRLGVAYSNAGQVSEALAIFDEALERNPKQAEVYNNRGYAQVLNRDFERAEEDFKAAIALDPDIIMAIANLASLYYNTNRLEDARIYAQRLIQLDGANPQFKRLWELVR